MGNGFLCCFRLDLLRLSFIKKMWEHMKPEDGKQCFACNTPYFNTYRDKIINPNTSASFFLCGDTKHILDAVQGHKCGASNEDCPHYSIIIDPVKPLHHIEVLLYYSSMM